MTSEERRRQEIADWMRSLGSCRICAIGMAIAAVEQETTGVRYDWRAVRGTCTARPRSVRGVANPSCEELVRAHWAERPRREQKAVAA